jgi:hypothetical protein
MSIDPRRCSNSSAARDLAKGLKAQLPRFFGLRYDERVPVKPRAASDSESEEEEEALPMGGAEATTEKDLWRMPDLFESEKELGKRLQYQLSYSLLFKPSEEASEEGSEAGSEARRTGGGSGEEGPEGEAGRAAAAGAPAGEAEEPEQEKQLRGEDGGHPQGGVEQLPPPEDASGGLPAAAAEDDIAPGRVIVFESYSTDEED